MHEHCAHDLRYCKDCDVVWCKKCDREWGTSWAPSTITTTTVPYETATNYPADITFTYDITFAEGTHVHN
jgi:hypothetical protein